MKRATAILLLIILSACGGGDPEDFEEDRKTTIPVDCVAQPEVCK